MKWRKILTCVALWTVNLFTKNRNAGVEIEDRELEEQTEMEGENGEILKCGKSKMRYTRSHLLPLTGLEHCKALPEGFDISVLSDALDVGGTHTAVTSYHNNACGQDSRKQDSHSQCLTTVSTALAGIIGPKHQEYDQVYNLFRKSKNPYRPPHTCKDANTKSEKPNSVTIKFGAEEDLLVHKKTTSLHINKRSGVPVTSESSELVNLTLSIEAADNFLGERSPSCEASKAVESSEVIDSLVQNTVKKVGVGEFFTTFPSRTLEEHHRSATDSEINGLLAIEMPFVSNVDKEMCEASSDSDDMPLLGANGSFLTSLLIESGAYETNCKDIRTSILAGELEMDKSERNPFSASVDGTICMPNQGKVSKPSTVPDEEELLSFDYHRMLDDCLPDEDSLITVNDLIGDKCLMSKISFGMNSLSIW